MYECSICLSLNHSSRLHCALCGAVPAKYSITGKPFVESDCNPFSPEWRCKEIVAAYGCSRASQHHASRVYLRTVTLDYYAE